MGAPSLLRRLVPLALALPLSLSAQGVSVRAYVTPGNTVGVGRPFVLNLEVSGTQYLGDQPDLPDLGDYAQYLGSSTQSSMRMVNGHTTVSFTIQYRYQALREGTFTIPSFEVNAGGSSRQTDPIEVTVTSAPAGTGTGTGTGAGGGGSGPQPGGARGDAASQDLFITAEATKSHVLDGEPLVVEYRLWTRVNVSSYTFTRIPEPEGFWVEDVTPSGPPQVEQLTRNGRQYTTAVIRRVALVPSGPGRRTIEPVGLEAQVRVRSNDPFADFFGGGPLFGGTVQPMAVLSDPVTIDVGSLPPGRPEPFSGMIGTLSITSELDRDSVDANSAVTLTVHMSGEGNVRSVPTPELELDSDFEVFPPKVTQSDQPFGPGLSGEKTFEYVLIPRAPGLREIPAISMGYYDERAREYRTAASEPLSLTVTGTAGEGGASLPSRGGVAQLREDIRFIHLGSEGLRASHRILFDTPMFWIFALLPLAGIAGAMALRRHQDLLEGDVAYARGRRAGRVARKRLAEARKLAGAGDARPFYAEVARALRGLVADKMNLAEAGLQATDLEARLSEHGVDAGTVEEVRACLDHCDRQRFAPPGHDPEEKTRFLARVGQLMTVLDRMVRR